ncbi:hypothetical protein OF83DRAFT_111207 [Amylostereum chailletii]|nr:hypothetical protein OF83DRAFT_111207 [Amylostereum chailletii]
MQGPPPLPLADVEPGLVPLSSRKHARSVPQLYWEVFSTGPAYSARGRRLASGLVPAGDAEICVRTLVELDNGGSELSWLGPGVRVVLAGGASGEPEPKPRSLNAFFGRLCCWTFSRFQLVGMLSPSFALSNALRVVPFSLCHFMILCGVSSCLDSGMVRRTYDVTFPSEAVFPGRGSAMNCLDWVHHTPVLYLYLPCCTSGDQNDGERRGLHGGCRWTQ